MKYLLKSIVALPPLLQLNFINMSICCLGGNWEDHIAWLESNIDKEMELEIIDGDLVSIKDGDGIKVDIS
jgi:hypothetical protein